MTETKDHRPTCILQKIPENQAVDPKNKYNDLPHFLYEEEEYEAVIHKTNLDQWANKIQGQLVSPFLWSYEFTIEELEDLREACHMGGLTGRRPKQFEEELTEIEARMEKSWPQTDQGWFFKFGAAAPKDTYIPSYGCKSPHDVVNAIVTSARLYRNCLNHKRRDRNTTLYFSKFIEEFKEFNEWRVFVLHGKIRAISQYIWHQTAPWYGMYATNNDQNQENDQPNQDQENDQNDSIYQVLVKKIQNLLAKVLKHFEFDTFVMDVYCDILGEDKTPKVIELNNYICSGGCLFSWHNDSEILSKYTPKQTPNQKEDDQIIVRIVSPN